MAYQKEEIDTDLGWTPIQERGWKFPMWNFWQKPFTFCRACFCPCVVYADLREMLDPDQSYFNSIMLYIVTIPMLKHFLLSGAQRVIVRGRFFIHEDEYLGIKCLCR
eukprot:NODE_116_length_18347_cov_2.280962.p19 type:complete len:107 gc:universal NODE_116_length_18347_cov_2.280962:14610-14290(-)